MVIGIDASRAVKQIRTGVEQYSWELIQHILALKNDHQFRLYAPHLPKDVFRISDRTEWRILPKRRLWSQVTLAGELKKDPPSALFVPAHVIPFMSHVPSVVTIHDLAYRYFPQSYSYSQRNYLNFSTSVSVSKAQKIIVPSESTKHDLISEYPEVSSKVVVIPHGINHRAFIEPQQGERPIQAPYIFFIGRIEEKKNIRLLVEAFRLLNRNHKEVHLVLAGSNGFGFDRVQKAIQALPKSIRSRIHQPGYLPHYDFVRYMSHADIFAFPSLYEGFGMPILEAMAAGRPIVCSNSSSLPEVAGDAAILLPADNPEAWCRAMERLLSDPALVTELRDKGKFQAAKFTWTKSAEDTLRTIIDAVG